MSQPAAAATGGKTVVCTDVNGHEYTVPVAKLAWRPAAYGMVVQGGRLLLARQYGKHTLPDGGVELGESPEAALVREIKEETGFDVARPRLVHTSNSFFAETDEHGAAVSFAQCILLFYVCELAGGEASIGGIEDSERPFMELPAWVRLDELNTIAAGSTFDWRRVVREYLSLTPSSKN